MNSLRRATGTPTWSAKWIGFDQPVRVMQGCRCLADGSGPPQNNSAQRLQFPFDESINQSWFVRFHSGTVANGLLFCNARSVFFARFSSAVLQQLTRASQLAPRSGVDSAERAPPTSLDSIDAGLRSRPRA